MQGSADARFDGAEWQVQRVRNLVVRQVFKKGETQRLTLLGGQLIDGSLNRFATIAVPGDLNRFGIRVGYVLHALVVPLGADLRTTTAPPQLVKNAIMGD